MTAENKGRSRLPGPTDRIALGSTGVSVSPVCVGMVADPDALIAAYDAGINFFFLTADMHWPLYESTRQGLRRLFEERKVARDDAVVAVVSYTTQPEFCSLPFLEVVRHLPGLDRIDVLVIGGAYGGEFLRRASIYRTHKRTGFVGARAIGTTFHDRAAALTSINSAIVDIAYVRYNALHDGARSDLFPLLEDSRRIPVFNFKSTMGHVDPEKFKTLDLDDDYWVPSFTDHYRFVLTRPQIDGILVALGEPGHVDQLCRALEQGPLTEEEETYCTDLARVAAGEAQLAK